MKKENLPKIIAIIVILLIIFICFSFESGSSESFSNSISRPSDDDKSIQIMELEEKVADYKTCIEDTRYTVDNALSNIKYPISNNDYNEAINTIDGIDWCGL